MEAAWVRVYLRTPEKEEMAMMLRFAEQQIRLFHQEPHRVAAGSTIRVQVLTNLCQAMLNSNEFLYVD